MAIGEGAFGRIWALEPAREADWDALYADQLPRVYNYFRYRVGDGAVAEDLTSRTFEKAWVARNRYRRDLAGFATWLMTIARNVAIDHYRRRRDHAPLEAAEHVAGGDDPHHLAERREQLERLSRLLGQLPDRDRELVSLKYGAELTNRAIAKQMKLTETNVGTLLHRAVQKLRADWNVEGA
ncbi:MAG TPA: sigma-70 family RNA polymerase sigma factor [Methylomirabilota bacterium]|jgi:RNA polymerase sigma-70 factor (ECF subfamily)|nr:sigma-70 family RNA polymerase sigma factor [Methylomirabilota bacterium]